MPTMQVDNEEVEEHSNRLLKAVKDYIGGLAELNPSEISLELSLTSHELWEGEGSSRDDEAIDAFLDE